MFKIITDKQTAQKALAKVKETLATKNKEPKQPKEKKKRKKNEEVEE